MVERGTSETTMAGQVVVMTGATSGIGAVAAQTLAERGARLVVVARDRGRADALLTRLRQANPAAEPTVYFGDLSRLAEAKRVAAAIAAAEPRIDVLANNAGAVFGSRQVTPDGLERTFVTNHMAYVVMALGLRGPLAASGHGRVVNTASAAHRAARYVPDDIQSLRRYNGWSAYARSKLYNILFTRELSRRWQGSGITVNCFHPGFVATRFGDDGGIWLGPLLRLAKLIAISPTEGAKTLIDLAASPAVASLTGLYFDAGRPATPTSAAQDDTAAASLWTDSLRLGGLVA